MTLESGLVVQPSSQNTPGDVVIRDDGRSSIVERQARHATSDAQPVFRSQSGQLLTLPGGVLLVLDDAWDGARVDRFLADHGIAGSDAEARDWAVNAFFVRTGPGFASLDLANALAGQEGRGDRQPELADGSLPAVRRAALLAVVAALATVVGAGQVGAQNPLGAPTPGTIAATTNALTVPWTAPADTGGAAITAYDLRYIATAADETDDANWTVLDDAWVTGGGALSGQVGDLEDGVGYDVQVRAVNASGDVGPWSDDRHRHDHRPRGHDRDGHRPRLRLVAGRPPQPRHRRGRVRADARQQPARSGSTRPVRSTPWPSC